MNRSRSTAHLPPLAGLAAIALLIGGHDLSRGGLGWSDAPLHAMDGAFVLEYVRAWPADAPAWAGEFFVRHPCLGIIVYYPPLFAVVEAAMFAVFGVHVAVARATVLLFVVGAAWLMYALAARHGGRGGGFVAALWLLLAAHGVTWMRDVMLEWPALFWLLAATWAYTSWRRRPGATRAALLAGFLVAAFLTKQTAGFLVIVLTIDVLADRRGRLLLRRSSTIVCALSTAGAIGAYLTLTSDYANLPPLLLKGTDAWAHLPTWSNYTYYVSALPQVLGWPLLACGLIGALPRRGMPGATATEAMASPPSRSSLGRVRAGRSVTQEPLPDGRGSVSLDRLMWLWLGAWWLISTLMAAKEPRYFFYAVVPAAWWAAAPWRNHVRGSEATSADANLSAPASTRLSRAIVLVALIAQAALIVPLARGRLPDLSGAARALAARPDADIVLYDGVREGQFVFDAIADAAARERLVVLRGSKLLYSRAARGRYLYAEHVRHAADILARLDEYGIRYVLVESGLPLGADASWDPPPRRWLRDLVLDESRFALRGAWTMGDDDPAWAHIELRLYEYVTCPPRRTERITLPFPSMGRDVTLRLPGVTRESGEK